MTWQTQNEEAKCRDTTTNSNIPCQTETLCANTKRWNETVKTTLEPLRGSVLTDTRLQGPGIETKDTLHSLMPLLRPTATG
jgi:hypothetical protein